MHLHLIICELGTCMLSRQMGLRHKKTEDAKKCPFCYTLGSFPSKITRTMWTTFNSDGFTLKHTHGQLVLFWYRCPHLTYRYWNLVPILGSKYDKGPKINFAFFSILSNFDISKKGSMSISTIPWFECSVSHSRTLWS